jgi:hypothetical protein
LNFDVKPETWTILRWNFLITLILRGGRFNEETQVCGSACKTDPDIGVIGVQEDHIPISKRTRTRLRARCAKVDRFNHSQASEIENAKKQRQLHPGTRRNTEAEFAL